MSRSSSSDSSVQIIDEFGRILPSLKKSPGTSRRGSRSRSRSHGRSHPSRSSSHRRSHSRSHSRSQSHRSGSRRRSQHRSRRSRSRSRSRSRRSRASGSSRHRSRSGSLELILPIPKSKRIKMGIEELPKHNGSFSPDISRRTTTNDDDIKSIKARVFIGNLATEKITNDDVEEMFKPYGKILGVSTHQRGFGFVQFEKESEAIAAVQAEHGGLLKGRRIDVKMAMDGRRGPRPKGSSDAPSAFERERPAPPPVARERSPVREPYEDRYRDPYPRDPPRDPPRRDDPYYPDPYTSRRPLASDPYYDRYREDPYRRDPYADPYRDPYYRDKERDPYYDPYTRKPPATECEIVIMNRDLKQYGEHIEKVLKSTKLITKVMMLPDDQTVPVLMEEAMKRGVLFLIIVNTQNQVHESLTVNILHGTPQEHRNMPLDDAVPLLTRSFQQYTQTLKEKSAAALPPPAPLPPPPPPSRPPSDIFYLLNLLADRRELTADELHRVMVYIRDKRDRAFELEGRRPPEDSLATASAAYSRPEDSAGLRQQQQQQDLQKKILGMLGGQGEGLEQRMPVRAQQQQGNGAEVSSILNFDNPNVKKALDNLISSGPSLLNTISTAAQDVGAISRQQQQPLQQGSYLSPRDQLVSSSSYGAGLSSQRGGAQRPQGSQHPGHPAPSAYAGQQTSPRGQTQYGQHPSADLHSRRYI